MQKDILNLFDNIAIARVLEFFDSVIYLNSFNIILSARYMIFSNKVAELLFFTLNLPQHRNRDIWYSANLCELIKFVKFLNIFNNSQVNTNISSSSININNLYWRCFIFLPFNGDLFNGYNIFVGGINTWNAFTVQRRERCSHTKLQESGLLKLGSIEKLNCKKTFHKTN